MAQDQIHPQNNNLANKLHIDTQKISELQPQSVFAYLGTTATGLSYEESHDRIDIYGDNTIQSKKSFHPVRSFARQLVNLMAIILWAASILAIIPELLF